MPRIVDERKPGFVRPDRVGAAEGELDAIRSAPADVGLMEQVGREVQRLRIAELGADAVVPIVPLVDQIHGARAESTASASALER